MLPLSRLLFLLLAGAAQAEWRVGNEAEAVATTLGAQGFAVILVKDTDRREMTRRLSRFTGHLGPGDAAVVFCAGHGVEIEGGNHLLRVDIVAPDSGASDFVASEASGLSDLLDRVRATGWRSGAAPTGRSSTKTGRRRCRPTVGPVQARGRPGAAFRHAA